MSEGAFFTFDENEAKGGFEPLPVGEYETIISNVENKTSSNGNPMLAMTLTVREDVPQEGGGRKLFDNLVMTEKAKFKFHQLFKALGFTNGARFNSLDEIAQAIAYKPLRVKTKHELDNRDNVTIRDRVHYYIPTEHPLAGGAAPVAQADPFAAGPAGQTIDISEDDLPF